MTFQDHFSGHAAAYAAHRPTYPAELFAWLASVAPATTRAWDCATGNGQAALALAQHFAEVVATDASENQVRSAAPHPRVRYVVAPAESSGLDAEAFDLVTVAQAFHWFDFDAFHAEARRVLRPGGVLAVWGYGAVRVRPDLDPLLDRFHYDTLGAYWPPDRKWVDERYETLPPMPFEPIAAPAFEMVLAWRAADLAAYQRTWSATQRYLAAHGADPVAAFEPELAAAWPEGGTARIPVRWPLFLRVGRR